MTAIACGQVSKPQNSRVNEIPKNRAAKGVKSTSVNVLLENQRKVVKAVQKPAIPGLSLLLDTYM